MFPWGFICVCVFVFQGLLPSDPQREGFGVLAKPETAAYVLQNPNDVILPFWQAVTSHMHTETEMLFRAPLTTASHLSLSPSISLAFFHLHGGLMYAMHDAELLFCLRLRCFEKIFSFLNLWIWETHHFQMIWNQDGTHLSLITKSGLGYKEETDPFLFFLSGTFYLDVFNWLSVKINNILSFWVFRIPQFSELVNMVISAGKYLSRSHMFMEEM